MSPRTGLPANHIGHALNAVIDGYRQMIACRDIAPGQNDVAPFCRSCCYFAGFTVRSGSQFVPTHRPREAAECCLHVQPPGMRFTIGNALGALRSRQSAIVAGIMRRAIWIARPDSTAGFGFAHPFGCFRAAQKGRIDQIKLAQFGQRRLVIGKVPGLTTNRTGPFKAEPGEILKYRRLEFGPRPCKIDILEPQQELATVGVGELPVEKRRSGMTDMEQSVRAGGEADNRSAQPRVGCGVGV